MYSTMAEARNVYRDLEEQTWSRENARDTAISRLVASNVNGKSDRGLLSQLHLRASSFRRLCRQQQWLDW